MTAPDVGSAWRARLAAHAAEPQHRNAYALMVTNVLGAATGFAFWFVLARLLALPPAEVGLGYAVVALGTLVGTVAKGGLDTALLRNVPGASREEGARLLRLAALLGSGVALGGAAVLGFAATRASALPHLAAGQWGLVGLIAALLVLTWLQDAYFLAEGDARLSLRRNVVLSAGRLALPIPVVLLGLPHPVAASWALALVASALAAGWLGRHLEAHGGRLVPRAEFLRSAARNVTGSAAEFLPGLLLVPVVLALHGAAEAAYFGMAWTAASTLFLASAAIGRSALAEMVRHPSRAAVAGAVRRAGRLHLWTVAPAAAVGVALSPWLLLPFGAAYDRGGALPLAILCASSLFVAPTALYMGTLRATERPGPLLAFPLVLLATLAALVPALDARLGTAGIALAWLLAHVPLAAFSAWRLARLSRGAAEPAPGATPSAPLPPEPSTASEGRTSFGAAAPSQRPAPRSTGVIPLAAASTVRGDPHAE